MEVRVADVITNLLCSLILQDVSACMLPLLIGRHDYDALNFLQPGKVWLCLA